ncbi:MAG: molecular chaperone DnaJ [Parcubacteria group bacterium Gr01-1014_70]|nr:MAG: molecular chaperone DnaJ [Parcubacteria group bacterium Gr01-1014_70]
MKDYYHVLGIPRNASLDDIKKAYRRLAHQFHPDKAGGNEEKFKEVNEAYQVLGNEQKRAQYDRFGSVGHSGSSGNGGGFEWDFSNFEQGFEGVDLGDIFGDVFGFGNSGGGRQTPRGRDIAIDIEMLFSDAVFGTNRTVLLRKNASCAVCGASGKEPGTKSKTCLSCNGSGSVHETRRSFLGTFTKLRPCSICHGTGQVPETPCRACKGLGVAQGTEEITVSIPAGVSDGEMIKLVGKGEAISGGLAGDLYVKIHVLADKKFNRVGHDITTTLEISVTESLLGIEKKLDTLEGALRILVPAGTASNSILRIRGKGVPRPRGGRGDLLITVLVKPARKLSKHAKELLEELKKEGV